MKYIISGTDRPGSNSLKISKFIQSIYKSLGEEVEVLDLSQIKEGLFTGPHYGTSGPDALSQFTDKIIKSEGLIVVSPEYNGSMPGVLKYFIDHLKFPESFEFRPVCFVGLGGMFGGLRPVEHLQQVFGYRNAYIYPERVFLMNVWKLIQNDELTDAAMKDLLLKQAKGFRSFCSALQGAGIDANSLIKSNKK